MADYSGASKIYTIIVSCGTAIATSTHVALKLKEILAEDGIQIHTIQCRVPEVPDYADQADMIVTTAQVPFDLNIPIINGLPFLTGVGIKEVIKEIVTKLKDGEKKP
jgi:PTS system galactitol-specific IIB component